ncbi:MAG TPA: cysteine desulfurase family protein [Clostridiaceae bacterium]
MEVYFDNSATTRMYTEAIEEVNYIMKNIYGNPSSAYSLGIRAEKMLNKYREDIAKTINCSIDEIVFTSGGSESNNFLVKGFARIKCNMITTEVEHPSVLNTFKCLEEDGIKVTYLKVNTKGRISLEELSDEIDKDTQLISVMLVNNEIGTIEDIESIGILIKEKSKRAKFHVDAVQGYGKLKIDVKKSFIDLMSVSSHKIHGPRGVGFAYVRRGLEPKPLIYGGGQERGLRSGTENLANIAGFSKASEIVHANLKANFQKVMDIKKYFISKLSKLEGARINNEGDTYSPFILSVTFSGIRGEVLLHMLEEKGIYVSMGSACGAKRNKESYVLKAIGFNSKEISSTIRFSFSENNNREEIDYAIDALFDGLKFLRRINK